MSTDSDRQPLTLAELRAIASAAIHARRTVRAAYERGGYEGARRAACDEMLYRADRIRSRDTWTRVYTTACVHAAGSEFKRILVELAAVDAAGTQQ